MSKSEKAMPVAARMFGTFTLLVVVVGSVGHYSHTSNPMPTMYFVLLLIGAIMYEGTR